MRHLLLALAVTGVAIGLAGCGNATQDLDFKLPSGYESKLNLFGTEMWVRGSQNPEVLFLMHLPVKTSDADFDQKMDKGFDSTSLPANMRNAKISERRRITICGDHPAYLMKATSNTDQSGAQRQENMEMLFTAWNDQPYLAMYMYPQNSQADPASEDAIESVCMKKPI